MPTLHSPHAALSRRAPAHTIIVGAGIVGVCCAYYLARRGHRVTVIDRDPPGIGASSGNAGLIAAGQPPIPKPGLTKQAIKWMFDSTSPLYIPPRFNPDLIKWLWQFHRACNEETYQRSMKVLAQLGHATMQCFEDILSTEGIAAAAEYRAGGQIEVFKTEATRDLLREEGELLQRFGFAIEELDADALRRREPAYVDDVLGAVVLRDSAFADPGKFTIELTKSAERYGAEIVPQRAVERIEVKDGRFTGVRLDGDGGRRIEGDALVLAAGAWTTELAKSIGLNVPLQAAKGYHLNLTSPPVNINMAGVLKETFVAVNPINGGLRLAGTLEFSGLDDRLRRNRLEALLTGAKQYIRGIEETDRISEWFGYRPCTADGLPVIGPAPRLDNVYVATGHAMMGFALGPVTGRLISECILDRKPSIDLAPLSIDRFPQKR